MEQLEQRVIMEVCVSKRRDVIEGSETSATLIL